MSVPEGEIDFQARGFAQRIGFGTRPAVLVVDLIKGFTDPARPLGADLDEQIIATSRVLDSSRGVGVPILYTTTHYHPSLVDAGVWALKSPNLADLSEDGDGHELDPRLGRRADEMIVLKKYASGFFGTDLAARLTSMRVDTVIVTGATTSGCVRATVVDAMQSGFRPMIVMDAVGDRSRSAHEQSLLDMDNKYADVVKLHEALEYLGTVGGTMDRTGRRDRPLTEPRSA